MRDEQPKPLVSAHSGPWLLSVVAPMLDEGALAPSFYARVRTALEGIAFELIVVDDGSTDDTPLILAGLAAADPRVRVVTLSRRFGHQAAITAGLDHARGDAVVMIDGDLQDPPELIPDMVDAWRAGADVVSAVRTAREGETAGKRATAHVFYRLLRGISEVELPADAGDFRLLDRRAADALCAMPERIRYLRGMSAWIGFTQATVPYRREARSAGRTKFSAARMLRFAADGICSFSRAPLRMVLLAGVAVGVVGTVGVAGLGMDAAAGGTPSGLLALALFGCLLAGLQLVGIGVVGEYVGRTYDEARGRPLYVVASRTNTPVDESPARLGPVVPRGHPDPHKASAQRGPMAPGRMDGSPPAAS